MFQKPPTSHLHEDDKNVYDNNPDAHTVHVAGFSNDKFDDNDHWETSELRINVFGLHAFASDKQT